MNGLLESIKSFAKKVSIVFHVTKTCEIYVQSNGAWKVGKTDVPGFMYAIVNGSTLLEQQIEGHPMWARYEWAENKHSKPPKRLYFKDANGRKVKYIRFYASQGNLKNGVAEYLRCDIWRKLKKLQMPEVAEVCLSDAGEKSGMSVGQIQNKIARLSDKKRKLTHESDIVESRITSLMKKRSSGKVEENEYNEKYSDLCKKKAKIRQKSDETELEIRKLESYIEFKQIDSRTQQKRGQWIQLHGTGVNTSGIKITVNNAHMTEDDARTDKVEGFVEVDQKYSRVNKVNEAKFCGMDGTIILGSNWKAKIEEVLLTMVEESRREEMKQLVFKAVQLRVWKGVGKVVRPVSEIAKKRNIELVPDKDGKLGIRRKDDYENEFVFTDDSILFTKSTVKNVIFFQTWEQLVNNLLIDELMITSMHFTYNKVKLNRQFWQLMMNQATDEEIEASIEETMKEIRSVGTGKGYIKEALAAVPEWKDIPSMRAAVLHPGLGMTINKKFWNKIHRAGAGKVVVSGDCLVAVPDEDYIEDYICKEYGFFEDSGKKSGSLGKNNEGIWQIRVPHAKERGLVGKIVVLGRSPYVSPIAAIAIVVGDSDCDGIIEMPMQEGSPFAAILACDWDGDHIYVIYDENIVNAAIRMNRLVISCGFGASVFEDMPGDKQIKVDDEDVYMAKAMGLSDVGLATTPIFKLASMIPVGAKPDDLVRTCYNGEMVRVREIVWAMILVNAAVTRAADAIKRGAPNGFNETDNGRMIGQWTRGTEMSKLNDHCEEMLGCHTDDTYAAFAAKVAQEKTGLIDWTNSGIDRTAWMIGIKMTGDTEWLESLQKYEDVKIQNGGWITHPERGVDWIGYDWHRWSTVNPDDYELNIDLSTLKNNVYVQFGNHNEWMSREEAIKLWTDGVDVNLENELNIALIYSRLYRKWQSASAAASTWKRKVDLTENARLACYSIIKACYVEEMGFDGTDLDEYAKRCLYLNLGSYFMSRNVTDTTADELRDWSKKEKSAGVPNEFYEFMLEANNAWISAESTDADKEIIERLKTFKNKVKTEEDMFRKIELIAKLREDGDDNDGFPEDGRVTTEEGATFGEFSADDFNADDESEEDESEENDEYDVFNDDEELSIDDD